jgi:hypothetical protein
MAPPGSCPGDRGTGRALRLIAAHQRVLRSDWSAVQPRPRRGETLLEFHSWDEYAEGHLGLYRAAEWRHKGVELAMHDLLRLLDRTSA